MRKRIDKRLEPPTPEEIAKAVELGHEVMAISADNDRRCLFLKFSCRNGDEGLIWFDGYVADYLLRHLERVFLGADSDPDSGSRITFAKTVCDSYGRVPIYIAENPRPGRYARPSPPQK